MKNKSLSPMLMTFLVGLAGLAFSSSSLAEEAAPTGEKFDLNTITCGEILALPEEDAGYSLVLLLGYSAGLERQAAQSPTSIATKIKTAFEICSKKPELEAVKAFATK